MGESFIATKFLRLTKNNAFRLRKQTFKLGEKITKETKKIQREAENSRGVIAVCEVNVKAVHLLCNPIQRHNPT